MHVCLSVCLSMQVHVLTFTVYQLLSVLSPTLKSGDLDACMNMLIDVRFTPQTRIDSTMSNNKDGLASIQFKALVKI